MVLFRTSGFLLVRSVAKNRRWRRLQRFTQIMLSGIQGPTGLRPLAAGDRTAPGEMKAIWFVGCGFRLAGRRPITRRRRSRRDPVGPESVWIGANRRNLRFALCRVFSQRDAKIE